jgi:hypothetical protein
MPLPAIYLLVLNCCCLLHRQRDLTPPLCGTEGVWVGEIMSSIAANMMALEQNQSPGRELHPNGQHFPTRAKAKEIRDSSSEYNESAESHYYTSVEARGK